MTKKRCKVLVCCHKKDIMATQEPYMPIHVGKALHPDVDLGIQGDNTGDNISLKNGSYCELTGMYWAWKNLKDVDVIGLCHYRRYFDFHGQTNWINSIEAYKTEDFYKMDLSIPHKVIDNLKDGHAVVAKNKYYMYNLHMDYCQCHISDDFRVLKQVFKDLYPDFANAFVHVMFKSNALIHYNMFIMTWHDYNEYCKWLFEVLGEVEKRTDITHYNPVQARIYGYMAERLFNIWLYAKQFKLIQKPVLWFNDDPSKNVPPLTLLQRNMRGCIATFFSRQWKNNIDGEEV